MYKYRCYSAGHVFELEEPIAGSWCDTCYDNHEYCIVCEEPERDGITEVDDEEEAEGLHGLTLDDATDNPLVRAFLENGKLFLKSL